MLINKTAINKTPLVHGVVAGLLMTQLSACGTILYPERRGQTNGHIDVGVAVLDAVGLLFFFVPGVVAFGVDFITGAIYLPGGGVATLTPDEIEAVQSMDNKVNIKALQKVLAERNDLALPESVISGELQAKSMNSLGAMMTKLYGKESGQHWALAKAY